jgi:hypothetical protein
VREWTRAAAAVSIEINAIGGAEGSSHGPQRALVRVVRGLELDSINRLVFVNLSNADLVDGSARTRKKKVGKKTLNNGHGENDNTKGPAIDGLVVTLRAIFGC